MNSSNCIANVVFLKGKTNTGEEIVIFSQFQSRETGERERAALTRVPAPTTQAGPPAPQDASGQECMLVIDYTLYYTAFSDLGMPWQFSDLGMPWQRRAVLVCRMGTVLVSNMAT
jgi:hypothetical protein